MSVACFLLRWPVCQEDRAGMCLSTGSGSVSGLEIFPTDMVSLGLRQLPRLSFCSSVMMLSIHQSRPICLGPLSTCQSPARNEGRTLWKIGSDGLPSLSLQPSIPAQVFNTLSPVCLGVMVDSQDSLADSWVYFPFSRVLSVHVGLLHVEDFKYTFCCLIIADTSCPFPTPSLYRGPDSFCSPSLQQPLSVLPLHSSCNWGEFLLERLFT